MNTIFCIRGNENKNQAHFLTPLPQEVCLHEKHIPRIRCALNDVDRRNKAKAICRSWTVERSVSLRQCQLLGFAGLKRQ